MGASSKIEWTWTRVPVGQFTPAQLQLALDIGAIRLPSDTRGFEDEVILVPGYTFNPWIGCTKVDELCAHCYAAAQDAFRHWTPEGWGPGKPRKRTSEANWKKVRQWNEIAGALGVRQRVFCASLADWLDDDGVPIECLADLLALIQATLNLDWLLLSKRPEKWETRIHEAFVAGWDGDEWASLWLDGQAPANVWVGTSVGHQKSADTRIPQLLEIPARVRFLSCEPLLGPVDLKLPVFRSLVSEQRACGDREVVSNPAMVRCGEQINWVICGGESGPKARPMHPDWARSLRDQCAAAAAPFLFKQWGEWAPHPLMSGVGDHTPRGGMPPMVRVGKAAAGRLLDGVEHNGSPASAEVRA